MGDLKNWITFKSWELDDHIYFLLTLSVLFFLSIFALALKTSNEPKNDLWQSLSRAARIQPELCIRKAIPTLKGFGSFKIFFVNYKWRITKPTTLVLDPLFPLCNNSIFSFELV